VVLNGAFGGLYEVVGNVDTGLLEVGGARDLVVQHTSDDLM
jgi:hypothetical protein